MICEIISKHFFLLSPAFSLALTPKQYCESLESQKKGSYEILNFEVHPFNGTMSQINNQMVASPEQTVIKYCKSGKFCITRTIEGPIDTRFYGCVNLVLTNNNVDGATAFF